MLPETLRAVGVSVRRPGILEPMKLAHASNGIGSAGPSSLKRRRGAIPRPLGQAIHPKASTLVAGEISRCRGRFGQDRQFVKPHASDTSGPVPRSGGRRVKQRRILAWLRRPASGQGSRPRRRHRSFRCARRARPGLSAPGSRRWHRRRR